MPVYHAPVAASLPSHQAPCAGGARRGYRKALTLAGAVALLSGLGACRPAQDPNCLRFSYWGDTEEISIVNGLISDFEKGHPGVRIQAEHYATTGGYTDMLLTEFAGGRAPDVIFTVADQFDQLASRGQLADLGPWLAAERGLGIGDYLPSMVRRFSWKGELMALPRDIAPFACVYYNQAIFDAAGLGYPQDGWTWDDLRADALKLTRRDASGHVDQYGFADDWNLLNAWVLAGGGRHLDDYDHPTRFEFAQGGGLEGLVFRWRLLQVDRVMPTPSEHQTLSGDAMGLFVSGKLAMFLSGYWKTPGFRKQNTFHWDVAPFPSRPGIQRRYWCGGSGYAMRRGATNPALCWELIKFLGGPVGEARMTAAGLTQPALKALAHSAVFLDGKDPQNKKMLLQCAERVVPPPAWPAWGEFIRTIWNPMTAPLWTEGYKGDPSVLLKSVQDRANTVFFKHWDEGIASPKRQIFSEDRKKTKEPAGM